MNYPTSKEIKEMVTDFEYKLTSHYRGFDIPGMDVGFEVETYKEGLKDMLKLIKKINKRP